MTLSTTAQVPVLWADARRFWKLFNVPAGPYASHRKLQFSYYIRIMDKCIIYELGTLHSLFILFFSSHKYLYACSLCYFHILFSLLLRIHVSYNCDEMVVPFNMYEIKETLFLTK